MRCRIADLKIERLPVGILFHKRYGVIRDDIGDITWLGHKLALSIKRRTIIRASARLVRKPVCKIFLRYRTFPKMPFP